jgi:hypothetical protein
MFKILFYFWSRGIKHSWFCQKVGERQNNYNILHSEWEDGLIPPIFIFRHQKISPLLKEDEPFGATYNCWKFRLNKCFLVWLRHCRKYKLKHKKHCLIGLGQSQRSLHSWSLQAFYKERNFHSFRTTAHFTQIPTTGCNFLLPTGDYISQGVTNLLRQLV